MLYHRQHCTAFNVPQDKVQSALDLLILIFENTSYRLVSSSMSRNDSGCFDLLLIYEKELFDA